MVYLRPPRLGEMRSCRAIEKMTAAQRVDVVRSRASLVQTERSSSALVPSGCLGLTLCGGCSCQFVLRGVPDHIRSDNGPEFTATVVRDWLARVGVKTLFIAPGSPWENGYHESFNGTLRDQLLNGEIFYKLREAKVLLERWRWYYNHVRPHSSLGYKPPASEARLPAWSGSALLRLTMQTTTSNALADDAILT